MTTYLNFLSWPSPFNYQLFIVRDPGYEVDELVVVDGPGPDQLFSELVDPPEQQQHPAQYKEQKVHI